MSNIVETNKFGRAISDLQQNTTSIDSNSLIEISRDNKSYRATLLQLNSAIIDSFNLYENLNSIFDSYEYPSDTYFGKKTTFNYNPYIQYNKSFDEISGNNLATKLDVDYYLDQIGVCVPIHRPDSYYVYYSAEEKRWVHSKHSNTVVPKVLSPTLDGIWTSSSKLKFNFGLNTYSYTDEVVAEKNMMLNVTGNIVLFESYQDEWYEDNNNSFVALTIDGKIITLSFVKNILNIKNDDGETFVIGQFHFNCPIAKDTKFRIITNAECKIFGFPDKEQFSRKLYDSLNAVNLSYYDYQKKQ